MLSDTEPIFNPKDIIISGIKRPHVFADKKIEFKLIRTFFNNQITNIVDTDDPVPVTAMIVALFHNFYAHVRYDVALAPPAFIIALMDNNTSREETIKK